MCKPIQADLKHSVIHQRMNVQLGAVLQIALDKNMNAVFNTRDHRERRHGAGSHPTLFEESIRGAK